MVQILLDHRLIIANNIVSSWDVSWSK